MAQADGSEPAGERETGRLEAFSDGVFAIAITLLVLDLRVPQLEADVSSGAVLAALSREWPAYLAFVTSFTSVLIMWMNHHSLFKMARRADAHLMLANGFLLLLVTAVPFPTALLSEYLRSPAATTVAAVYAGTFVVVGLAFNILWRTVRRDLPLVPKAATGLQAQRISRNYRMGAPLYAVATLLAFVTPYLSVAVCAGLAVVWIVTVFERQPVDR